MKARWMGAAIEYPKAVLTEPGDIGLGAENYHFCLLVRCPVCHRIHVVDIEGSTHPNPRWSWNGQTLTAAPSYKIWSGGDREHEVCHWNLTDGAFIVHPDSTAVPTEGEEW